MDVTAGFISGRSRSEAARAARGLVNVGFALLSRLRCQELAHPQPVRNQEQALARLVRKASWTRFGRDHRFDRISSVGDFQRAVPLRAYEALWDAYLRYRDPAFETLTYPTQLPV